MKALTSFVGFARATFGADLHPEERPLRLQAPLPPRLLWLPGPRHDLALVLRYARRQDPHQAKVVFTKVFIDQVLWNPCFGVMFFSYVALLEAKGIQYVVDKVQNELLTSVTGSWKVWPLAHTINFRFIPSSQRVLYINTIQIGYNCFLSIIANREKPEKA